MAWPNSNDPAGKTLIARDGRIAILGGHALTLEVNPHHVRIGCTSLTIEAWRLLREQVDSLIDSRTKLNA